MQKHQVTPHLEIHEDTQTGYKSLYTTKELKPFTILSTFGFEQKLSIPNRYSVQVNKQEHIILKPNYLQYINHSCAPNVFFDTQRMELIVLRPIQAGEELAFFYPSTEWNMTEVFDCSCKSEHCLGTIKGASHLNYEQLTSYRLSDYIIQKYSHLQAIQNQRFGAATKAAQ